MIDVTDFNDEDKLGKGKEMIDRLSRLVGLPANLFYGTGIPACIIVIDKEHAQTAQFAEEGTNQVISGGSVFMIDASRGFIKDGNKNRLREQDIHKIIDTFTNLVTAVWCI
ncbi:TPA: N-6 DNA methylase [Neisseria meningitidis]